MKYCFISDIHSNYVALLAVLVHARKFKPDKYICLGDIVGYGAEPQNCIQMVQKISNHIISGNHDYAVIDLISTKNFNDYASWVIEWTKKQLNTEEITFLKSLKETNVIDNKFDIVHGSYTNPVIDYIIDYLSADKNFELLKTNLCFIGHTHRPLIFIKQQDKTLPERKFFKLDNEDKSEVLIDDKNKYIINLGSVGQPRDANNKASYGIYNSDTNIVTLHRVPYDIKSTQKKLKEHNFPETLIKRIQFGK